MPQSRCIIFSARPPFRSQLRCTLSSVMNMTLCPQCMLNDNHRNLLRPAMATDGQRAIYCGARCISMDSLLNLLRPATAIDGHVSRSTVVDHAYRLTVSPVYRYHDILLLPSFQMYCHRHYLSIDTFHSLLLPIGFRPRPLSKP